MGYLLFIAGLGGLSHIHDSFVKARICATALTFVSLFESVVWSDIPLAQEKVLAWTENAPVYQAAIGSVLNVILVWHVFSGILFIMDQLGRHELQATAQRTRSVFLVFIAGLFGLAILVLRTQEVNPLIALVAIGFGVVVICLMMILMLRMSKLLRSTSTSDEPAATGWT